MKTVTELAQKIADQELEACCSQLAYWGVHGYNKLYEARRPKSPSLKKQALTDFDRLMGELVGTERYKDWIASVHRALESLPD
jgi:hypothetical protein